MFVEKKRLGITPRAFTANGTVGGIVTIADTKDFFVKQKIVIQAVGKPKLDLEVKRVISPTQLIVGDPGSIKNSSDLSEYLLAFFPTISAAEQTRPGITEVEHDRAVYAEEPIVAKRSILVDEYGRYYNSTNPLPINANFSGDVIVDLDGFDLTEPDSVQITGSDDGTSTSVKRGARVDSAFDLRVGLSNGANKAAIDGSGNLSVTDVATQNAILNLPQDNIRQQILNAADRDQSITYADAGTKNQRITQIDYTSTSYPGLTARKTILYSMVGPFYIRTDINWSVI